tara:strand:- start:993 stop:1382 length:390 start_codon:yes stop_codon:yes gene_type:complete
MQTKNNLELEIENNKDNFFISDSIKNIINFENKSQTTIPSLSISLGNSEEYSVLSYVKKKKKTTMLLQINKECLSSVILESFKNIKLFIDNEEVKSFPIDNYLINYEINYIENNNYLLKIKAWSKDNGI